MPRRPFKSNQILQPDEIFQSVLVTKLINKIMVDGKKNAAKKIVYKALEIAARKLDVKDPLVVLETAINNVAPSIQLKSRRIGGGNYQIPSEVSASRKTTLALMWIVAAVRSAKGAETAEKLARELIDANNNTGTAFRKKEDTHRMAEANRAFAHLGRF